MAEARRRPAESAVQRARRRERRREERRRALRRERRRRFFTLSGLGLSCLLVGAIAGAMLWTGGVLGGRSGPLAGVVIDSGPEPDREAGVPLKDSGAVREAMEAALTVPAAGDGPDPAVGPERDVSEALEAALARLYEEPLEDTARRTDPAEEARRRREVRTASLAVLSLPDVGAPDTPLWRSNAVAIPDPGVHPMIAIVLDDLGVNRPGARRAIALPPPLTLAFMTYADGLDRFAASAREQGHELLLHVPMEPRSAEYDPGPNVLAADLPPRELRDRLHWGLNRFEGFVGINNHMGSRFTASAEGMAQVMRELRARGLMFLDSVTSGASVGVEMARLAGVPYAQRDVFLDNEWHDRNAIRRQLSKLERVARRRGYAVGIGHPHTATLDVLATWLPEARRRGFALVPISAIVQHRIGIAQSGTKPAG